LIAWYVDDYVDFTKDQEIVFEQQLDVFFAWHRANELPRYVDVLSAAERALEDGLDAQEALAAEMEFRDALDRLQAKGLEAMLAVGVTLTPEQLDSFIGELETRQQEQEERWLKRDEGEYRERLAERITDNLEDYLGSLSKSQKKLVVAGADDYLRLDAPWLEDRKRWVSLLGGILRSGDDDWPDQVRAAVADRERFRSIELTDALEHNARVTRELVVAVVNERTSRQDKRLRRRIADLKEDFQALVLPLPAQKPGASDLSE
jgi:hypothetical protein